MSGELTMVYEDRKLLQSYFREGLLFEFLKRSIIGEGPSIGSSTVCK